MPKKKKLTDSEKVLMTSINLEERYKCWKDIYNMGCSDPCYEDGVNLNLVRNHIIYYKRQLEELLKNNFLSYPESYFYCNPPLLSNEFMSKDRKIKYGSVFAKSTKTLGYNDLFSWEVAAIAE